MVFYKFQFAYEGRRINSHDLVHFTQPRDVLMMHSEIAVRAGRELCRWASSVKNQQDKVLSKRLIESQNRETKLTKEIIQLNDKINRMSKFANY